MIVLVLIDHHMVEPAAVVVCDSRLTAYRAVASYLEAAAPVLVSTGERLAPKPADVDVEDYVVEAMEDIEGIDFDILEASVAGLHQTWCHANTEALRKLHTPRVETIKVTDQRL